MIWITIILNIIEAIPALITIIKEIWAATHPHAGRLHALTTLLLKHQDVTTASTAEAKAAVENDLRTFHRINVLGLAA